MRGARRKLEIGAPGVPMRAKNFRIREKAAVSGKYGGDIRKTLGGFLGKADLLVPKTEGSFGGIERLSGIERD